jgi:hypothetical protein
VIVIAEADYLSTADVTDRNRDARISPLDRHPIIQAINQHGWNAETCALAFLLFSMHEIQVTY